MAIGRVGFVYIITCVTTHKHYVGKTIAKAVWHRWQAHVLASRVGKSDLLIHRALRKHGVHNFIFDVLWEGPEEELNQMEIDCIAACESMSPRGYNLTAGGDGVVHSPSARRKISKKARERAADPVYRAQMSQSMLNFYATPEGELAKKAISTKLTGRKLSKKECANHSAGIHRRYTRQEERERTSSSVRKHYDSTAGAETRQKQSEAAKRRVAAGDYHTEETRRLLSDKAKAQHARQRAAGVLHAGKAYK